MKRENINLTSEREEFASSAKKRKPEDVPDHKLVGENEYVINADEDETEARDMQTLEATLIEVVTKRGTEKTC